MEKSRTSLSLEFISFLLLLLVIIIQSSEAKANPECSPSSCGNIKNISYPFRLTSDPKNCGDFRYNLSCENNSTVLYFNLQKFNVQAINYNNYTIRVSDPNIFKNNCSSIPQNLMTRSFYSFYYKDGYTNLVSETIVYLSCEKPVKSPLYILQDFCNTTKFPIQSKRHYYVILVLEDLGIPLFDLEESCRIEQIAPIYWKVKNSGKRISYTEIHNQLLFGFELSWIQSFAKNPTDDCHFDNSSNKVSCVLNCYGPRFMTQATGCGLMQKIHAFIQYYYKTELKIIGGIFGPRLTLGIPCVLALLIYKWRRRHLSMYDGIEEFLHNHKNLMPIRYSYSEIRKITKGFKEKLGQGGYGSVYKGKLRSGRLVGVKMLGKSNANGQDFINEVATIGRVHHVNVVHLVGFCVEGSKRALVYEFMPNGSLDKYIFSGKGPNSLSNEKIFEISLGIARGIEYLHRGCGMRILHFDIKPYNILLDDKFSPKISDFGLARLSPVDGSLVSLTAARGTIGYIAPELFYKNIGGVSSKADVYSYGMLLMEMASRRKNVNPNPEESSQSYFPSWIYDQFKKGNYIDIEDATQEESTTIRKMIIVALWCIQMKPSNRPSMKNVIDMLEGEVESLKMPPKPFSNSEEEPMEDQMEECSTSTSLSTLSSDYST